MKMQSITYLRSTPALNPSLVTFCRNQALTESFAADPKALLGRSTDSADKPPFFEESPATTIAVSSSCNSRFGGRGDVGCGCTGFFSCRCTLKARGVLSSSSAPEGRHKIFHFEIMHDDMCVIGCGNTGFFSLRIPSNSKRRALVVVSAARET